MRTILALLLLAVSGYAAAASTCPALTAPSNANAASCTLGASSCTVSCTTGSVPISGQSSYTLTCSNGIWTGLPTGWACSAVFCGVPPTIANGALQTPAGASCPAGAAYGTQCNVVCASTYTNNGATSTNCTASGTTGVWSTLSNTPCVGTGPCASVSCVTSVSKCVSGACVCLPGFEGTPGPTGSGCQRLQIVTSPTAGIQVTGLAGQDVQLIIGGTTNGISTTIRTMAEIVNTELISPQGSTLINNATLNTLVNTNIASDQQLITNVLSNLAKQVGSMSATQFVLTAAVAAANGLTKNVQTTQAAMNSVSNAVSSGQVAFKTLNSTWNTASTLSTTVNNNIQAAKNTRNTFSTEVSQALAFGMVLSGTTLNLNGSFTDFNANVTSSLSAAVGNEVSRAMAAESNITKVLSTANSTAAAELSRSLSRMNSLSNVTLLAGILNCTYNVPLSSWNFATSNCTSKYSAPPVGFSSVILSSYSVSATSGSWVLVKGYATNTLAASSYNNTAFWNDVNSDFNNSTGVFTAPRAGLYLFTANVMVSSISNGYGLTFGKNGVASTTYGCYVYTSYTYSWNNALTTSCIYSLSKGDYIGVYVYGNQASYTLASAVFGGVVLDWSNTTVFQAAYGSNYYSTYVPTTGWSATINTGSIMSASGAVTLATAGVYFYAARWQWINNWYYGYQYATFNGYEYSYWGYIYVDEYYSYEMSNVMEWSMTYQGSTGLSLTWNGFVYTSYYGGYFSAASGMTGFQVNPDFAVYGSMAWYSNYGQYMTTTSTWLTMSNGWSTNKGSWNFSPMYGSLIDATGTFTAPVSGLYTITVNAFFELSYADSRIIAAINGDTTFSPCMWFDSGFMYEKTGWCQGLAYLAAGTTVQPKFYAQSTIYGYWYLYYPTLSVQLIQLNPGH